jgi:hypothetical protein
MPLFNVRDQSGLMVGFCLRRISEKEDLAGLEFYDNVKK